jgi:hypothetical protein
MHGLMIIIFTLLACLQSLFVLLLYIAEEKMVKNRGTEVDYCNF